jgi:hypothetical protein
VLLFQGGYHKRDDAVDGLEQNEQRAGGDHLIEC